MAISQPLHNKKERSTQLGANLRQKKLFRLLVASNIQSLLLIRERFTLGVKANLELWGMENKRMFQPLCLSQTLKTSLKLTVVLTTRWP